MHVSENKNSRKFMSPCTPNVSYPLDLMKTDTDVNCDSNENSFAFGVCLPWNVPFAILVEMEEVQSGLCFQKGVCFLASVRAS